MTGFEQPPGGRSGELGQANRRYDAFHLRLWSLPGEDALLRVELRHLQTDQVHTANAVPISWLIECLRTMLSGAAPPSEQ